MNKTNDVIISHLKWKPAAAHAERSGDLVEGLHDLHTNHGELVE